MIDILTKIHDKFSLEFKVGFRARRKVKISNFVMNTWIFVPNSLDINVQTYSRENFYRDLRSNVRLITPVFLVRDIARGEAFPLQNLEKALNSIASSPTRSNIAEYEYQIKMFSAIFKSAIRDQIKYIFNTAQTEDRSVLFDNFLDDVNITLEKYRSLAHIIKTPTVTLENFNYFLFGDEFMSNLIEQQFFNLLISLEDNDKEFATLYKEKILKVIEKENHHKKVHGYPIVRSDSPNKNRDLVFRRGVLKKYIEGDLFLNARKKRDGVVAEQVYYSLAAGVSMIFATTVAFSFQQTYGNFTMPFFVALVVSYMLKDRIKELMRYYFAHKRSTKYFDNKITISIKHNQIGWSKEGFDFISEKNVPKEVIQIRSRSPLLEADNRYTKEKIILYRKMMQIDREKLDESSNYQVAGINEIIRFNVSSFMFKMDNPDIPLYVTMADETVEKLMGSKIYYLNFIIQFRYEDFEQYKRYRVIFNRNGIMEIEELK